VKIIEHLKGNKALVIIFLIIVLIVAILPSYYFYNQYKKTQSLLQNPAASSNTQTKELIAEVGKLMVLPANEQPTVATVSDIKKLADQPFFAHAQNGDKVLIYTQSKKAILYRESINKIIEVAPVNIGSGASTPTITPTVIQAIATVAIYNGTTTVGLAGTAENKIKTAVANVKTTSKSDAKNSYEKTIIIDISGKHSQIVSQLVSLLSGTVAITVPEGETKPDSDILVILGTNFTK
jgi:hypothetical protein